MGGVEHGDDDIFAGLDRPLVAGAVFGAHPVASAAVGGGLAEFPDEAAVIVGQFRSAGAEHGTGGEVVLGDRFRSGGRRRLDDGLLQRVLQAIGIVGRQILAAGVVGEAFDLGALFLGEPEADDVDGEIDAGLFEFAGQRAGIGVAGFDAVGDQHHRRLVFGEFELLGGHLHGGRERRLALGREFFGGRADRGGRAGGGIDQHFDVVAIAFAAMAIGHEAQFEVGRHAREDLLQRIPGDFDTGLAVDLRPHRAGGIEDQDGAVGGHGRERKGNQGHEGRR